MVTGLRRNLWSSCIGLARDVEGVRVVVQAVGENLVGWMGARCGEGWEGWPAVHCRARLPQVAISEVSMGSCYGGMKGVGVMKGEGIAVYSQLRWTLDLLTCPHP